MNRNIVCLSLAQASYWFAVLVGISLSSVLGAELAPGPELATLPYTLISISALLFTYVLSLLMQRFGRRAGFQIGAIAGLLAALSTVYAIFIQSFYLFCAASMVMGIYQASSVYYRLSALDSVPKAQQGNAVGWVLSGSLLAAVLGPFLAVQANAWFSGSMYAGPYLLTAIFGLFALLLLSSLPAGKQIATQKSEPDAIKISWRYPKLFWLGVANTAFGQFTMMLMMIVAPLSMHGHHHYPVSTGGSVIGWHIVGMFLPSLLSGKLLDRFSASKLIFGGITVFMLSGLVAVLGVSVTHYYLSLFLLGVGWNLMYVAGTWQYNHKLNNENKGRAQGLAEVLIALAAVLGAGLGGLFLSILDWQALNAGLLVLLLGMVILNGLLFKIKQQSELIH